MIESVILFAVALLLGTILFILVYKYIAVKKIEVNYGKHKNLEYALINNGIYLIISTFLLLMFYSLYENNFFEYILSSIPHDKEIIDSGLFTGLILVLVGIFIKIIYLLCLKIIRHKVILLELEEDEQTWVMIAGCILLFVVGLKNRDFIFSFSVLTLIVAHFFWVINNSIENVKKKLQKLKKLPIFTIIFIIAVFMISLISLFIPEYILQILFGLIIGITIGIIVCLYKENNKQKCEVIEMGMELKFRAWNKNKQIMEYIRDLYWFNENGVHSSDIENGNTNYIFMSYSGINDSKRTNDLPKGQEIYEGDIIMDSNGNIYRVIFCNGKFIADAKSGLIGRKDLELVISEKAYIVGNVYEKDTLKF